MRHAHSSLSVSRMARWCLAAILASCGLPLAAKAQPQPQASAPAQLTDPAAPSATLQHQPLPSSGSLVSQPTDWRAANTAVAAFPRGHADVVQWEKAHASGKAPAAPAVHAPQATPAHHHHGGQP